MKKFFTLLFFICVLFGCDKEVAEDTEDYLDSVITDISFAATTKTLEIGRSVSLVVNHTPSTLDTPTYLWQSSNSDIVEVSQLGRITARALGSATITVQATEVGIFAQCLVSVTAIQATSITLSANELDLYGNNTYTLSYKILPNDSADQSVTWSSSDDNVATVNNGVVTAINNGSAQVKVVMNNGVNDICEVLVTIIDVEGISLSASKLKIEETETVQLSAAVYPMNASYQDIVWTSSDENIAYVDSDGNITGVTVGEAIITATTVDGGYSASCDVTVNQISVKGIELSKSSLSMMITDSYSLSATVIPYNAVNQNIIWSSSNSSVATVDAQGKVYAISNGSTIITSTTEESGYVAECSVSVKPIEELVTIGAEMVSYSISSSGVFFKIGTRIYSDVSCSSMDDYIILNQVLLMYQDGTIIDRTDYIGSYIILFSEKIIFKELSISYDITQMKIGCFFEYKGVTYYTESYYSDWESI